jgi:hypothetical protein
MGWTETLLSYDDNPEGDPKVDRTDPLEMTWDRSASKRNVFTCSAVQFVVGGFPHCRASASQPTHCSELLR